MDEGNEGGFSMKNKKGMSTIFILFGFLIVFVFIIALIVIGSFSVNINDALSQNVTIGQVNLQEVSEDTFGKFNEMVLENSDWWGTAIIFGMVLGLFLTSYFTRNSLPKISIILDIFMIFVAFIFSLYLSAVYSTLVTSLTTAGETFAETYLPNTSFFILNLPLFTVIIGVVMMILFHSSIPRKSEEHTRISNIVPT